MQCEFITDFITDFIWICRIALETAIKYKTCEHVSILEINPTISVITRK